MPTFALPPRVGDGARHPADLKSFFIGDGSSTAGNPSLTAKNFQVFPLERNAAVRTADPLAGGAAWQGRSLSPKRC